MTNNILALLFFLVAAWLVAWGIKCMIRGSVIVHHEMDDEDYRRELSGPVARLIATIMISAGLIFIFHPIVGTLMMVGCYWFAWGFGREIED